MAGDRRLGTRRGVVTAVAVMAAALQACGHTSAIEQRFSHEYDCDEVEVTAIGGSSYEARGCGSKATYTCSAGSQFEDGVWGPQSCTREAPVEREWITPAARVSAPAGPDPGSVERAFDETRKLHVVRARFRQPGLGGAIVLVGAPEEDDASVLVHVMVPRRIPHYRACDRMRLLVNGEPFEGRQVAIDATPGRWSSGRFDFTLLAPLTREHPQLGVELCRQPIGLAPQQMPNAVKFVEIFSQIAAEVRAKSEAATSPSVP